MNRQAHTLTRPKTSLVPESVIFVDTETTQHPAPKNRTEHHLRLGVAIYTRYRQDRNHRTKDVFQFKSEAEFWKYAISKTRKKTVLYLISHNAVFDFTVLKHVTFLSQLGYKCLFVFDSNMRYIAKWRKQGHTIVILDNSNWFAGKLAKWGAELNLPKLEMPKGVSSEDKWFTYCSRDTEILFQLHLWYVGFLANNALGSWKFTIASSAFNSFRYRFMFNAIHIPDDEDEQGISRESYHGGRTEVFRRGEFTGQIFTKLDINSMYPYVMREYEYPTCFEDYHVNPSAESVETTIKTKAVIADVTLVTPQPYFVFKHGDRNIYPTGEFRTTLTTNELLLALTNDWVKTVHRCAVYRKRAIFVDYVDFFYRVKQDAGTAGKPLLRSFAKLYLNSLYGKFGQRGYNDSVLCEDVKSKLKASHGYNVRTGQRFTLRQVGHTILYSERSEEGYNSFCAIASEVTGNARLMLYDLVIRAKRENCYYCDTDSIIVNEEGLKLLSPLLDTSKLGFLKSEGESDKIDIVAPKHYLFEGHWTMKGVRKDAVKLSENTYSQEIWPGLNSILKTGKEVYYNYYQQKTLSPTIVSGMVGKEGFVTPFYCVDNRVMR